MWPLRLVFVDAVPLVGPPVVPLCPDLVFCSSAEIDLTSHMLRKMIAGKISTRIKMDNER